jgi:predicted RNA-binding protein
LWAILGLKGVKTFCQSSYPAVKKEWEFGGRNMCEANAYLLRGDGEELFMEAVDVIENEDSTLRVTSIYGEQKTIRARIRSMSLVDHKIILEE